MVYKSNKNAQEQKEMKKKLILDTAAQLFVNRGYHNTSVKDIVEQASISVGSFYFYFTSKDELLESLYDEMNDTFLNVLQDVYIDFEEALIYGLSKAIVNTLVLFQNNQDLSKILLNNSISTGPLFEKRRMDNNQRFYKIVEEIIRNLSNKSLIKCENVEVAAMTIMGGIFFMISNLLETNFELKMIPNYSYSVISYHLRALSVDFNEAELLKNIDQIIQEQGD